MQKTSRIGAAETRTNRAPLPAIPDHAEISCFLHRDVRQMSRSRTKAETFMTKGPKRAAIYGRVSTDGQTTDNQIVALREVAARRGWDIAEVYLDNGISGAKGRDKRPGFDRMLKDASRRKFDVVMAWAIDRMGRSLRDLIEVIEHLEATGIDLYLDQQNIDTTTPAGKLLFQVTGAFAEFERSMIRLRVNAGLARARAQGKRLGRPRLAAATELAIRAALAEGSKGMLKIAAEHGVGSGTVQRIKAEMVC
jgi:DNA invertase Pin-like site-specific DNA recombinase